jgi:hypothetical protein
MSTRALTQRLAGSARVLAYLALLLGLASVWSLHRVLAQAELAMSRSGEKLARELGPLLIGRPQTISLNGQRLVLSSRQSALEPHEVLERFARHCAGENGDAPEAVLSAPQQLAAQNVKDGMFARLLDVSGQLGVLRSERENEGHLACFARTRERAGLEKLAEDVQAFVEDGDFARLGELRYVTARKLDNGQTHVLVVWSEGPLRLAALFPERGDAPGSDMQDVPRPPASTRQFCALGFGHDYGLRQYAARGSSDQLLAYYARELPKRGWAELHELPDGGEMGDGVFARAYLKDGHAVAIAVHADPGQDTAVSLIDLGAVRHTDAL